MTKQNEGRAAFSSMPSPSIRFRAVMDNGTGNDAKPDEYRQHGCSAV